MWFPFFALLRNGIIRCAHPTQMSEHYAFPATAICRIIQFDESFEEIHMSATYDYLRLVRLKNENFHDFCFGNPPNTSKNPPAFGEFFKMWFEFLPKIVIHHKNIVIRIIMVANLCICDKILVEKKRYRLAINAY